MLRRSMLLLAAVGLAQSPADLFRKAPPAVDAALRERINEFYQLHITAKFRQAEALVAEDTKDFFYSSNKPKYLSCETRSIEYADDFTKAKAMIVCQMVIPLPGFMNKPMEVPHPSHWKVENGQWFWYVDPATLNRSPFGEMKAGAHPGTGAPPSLSSGPNVQSVMNLVSADRSAVSLKASEGSEDQVRVANKMPGAVQLRLDGTAPAGLEVVIDRAELKANEVATIRVKVIKPEAVPKGAVIGVIAEPIGKRIPIQVSLSPAG